MDLGIHREARALDAVDRVSNELTPERMEKVGVILDDVSATTANLRKMSEDIKDIGGDIGSVTANLRLLLKRAAAIDELLDEFDRRLGVDPDPTILALQVDLLRESLQLGAVGASRGRLLEQIRQRALQMRW